MENIFYKKEEKPEIDRFVELIKHMDDNTQNKMLIFMQGVQFGEHTYKGAIACIQ